MDSLSAGHEAMERADWQEAFACFETAVREQETPEALEALGMAAWWTNDAALVFHARERAYEGYRRSEDARSAARIATCLAIDYLYFRGEYAIATGWVQRGRRLLEGLEARAESGWLSLAEAQILVWTEHDFVTSERLSTESLAVGKALHDTDLEMAALACQGLAMVSQGRVAEGMRRLDEATMAAVSGEISDLDVACTACCCLIYACEWTRDYPRARQWIERMREMAERRGHPSLVSFCRVHYAGLLIFQGLWEEAEKELLGATQNLEDTQPALAAEGLVRLAELRCRQGRLEEASALLERAESPPFRALAGHLFLCGRAAVALCRRDAESAADLAHRFLRAVPRADRMERIPGLELLIQASIARGRTDDPRDALEELHDIASTVSTNPLQASVHFSEGLLAAASGHHEAARRRFEDALDLWSRSGALFDTAQARLELARILVALGRLEPAADQARQAGAVFERLGAVPGRSRAEALLKEIASTDPHEDEARDRSGLTPREREILCLLAGGKSNGEIASQLFLSTRTAERHISNIYEKIGAGGKTARAVATAYALRHGLVK